jgi:cytosine/uracil/thiamine/allantoin permease
MPLINMVIVLGVVAVILWVINSYIPMRSTIKGILNVIVIIALILWLLNAFGVLGSLSGIRIGK